MEVKLVVVGGTHNGREIPAPGPHFVIGRDENCQLRPQSKMVSRRHCEILIEDGSVKVRDLGSSNGTYVNGQRVDNLHEVKSGDKLRLGPLEFEVQLTVSVGGPKKSKVHTVEEAATRTVASKPKSDDDDWDISQWLEDDGPAPVQGDTQQLTVDQTVSTRPPQPKPVQSEAKPAGKAAGNLQNEKKKTADSRSAAAETLKRLFQGGGPGRPQ